MGVHIDGYITLAAHTVIVAHSPTSEPITGALADVVTAAWTCAEVAARLITPGNNNTEVTAAMKRVCEHFGVHALSGSVMHQVKRYVIDGSKNIAMHDATRPCIALRCIALPCSALFIIVRHDITQK